MCDKHPSDRKIENLDQLTDMFDGTFTMQGLVLLILAAVGFLHGHIYRGPGFIDIGIT